MRVVVVVCCLLFASGGCYGVHPPPAPPRHTALSLGITGLTLHNGMRVVLVRDPAATEVSVTMRYQVGSVDDTAAHPGMAHLVEHLMFQQMLGAKTLFAHLEDDATFFNAYTSFDATTFVTRAAPDHLDELLSIEAVRVGFRCTSINESAFEREREVVVNELRQRDAGSEVQAALHEALYPAGHPYRQPTGGSVDSVRAITRADACAFADAHYAPANGVLVVSGNVTPDQVIGSMNKFLARVAARTVTPPLPAPPVAAGGHKVEQPAPIDEPALVLAWPLPDDPKQRIEMLAVAAVATAQVDRDVKGRVASRIFGDERAPMLAIVVAPAKDETIEDVTNAARRALDDTPSLLERTHVETLNELAFDRMQQTAIYNEYAALETPATRDTRLAAAVLAGHDPNQVLEGEFAGLRELEPHAAASLARDRLGFDNATVVTLQPSGKKRGHEVSLAAAIHDIGQRRDPADPADAHHPLAGDEAQPAGIVTRTLANGLQVVLLPISSVPTVDIRLVFRAGTADEPSDRRGVALLAGNGLDFDLRYLNDLLLFVGAGGTQAVDVGYDTTTFTARGVDMHLDLLLAGLRRWVREGYYDDSTDALADVLRTQAKDGGDDGQLTDAWRAALYGEGHPYVEAGLARHISRWVSSDDAAAFRAAHFTPDNATLVIAGRFDAALANRWIDYLFANWHGHAAQRNAPRATPQPASLATIDDTTQAALAIALPATAGTRATRLVAAMMLRDVADDVRHQLGATYGLDAELMEARLASSYRITGDVDSARAGDAVQLLRDRIAQLHSDPAAAASAFVDAHKRVVTRLASLGTSGGEAAARVEQAIAIDDAPLSDISTAAAVRALTIDDMTATLGELDLARASVLLRGPDADVRHAFDVLGRTPTIVKVTSSTIADHETVPGETAARPHHERPRVTMNDLETALTDQGAPSPWALTVGLGYTANQLVEPDDRLHYDCCAGYSLIAEVGYRFDRAHAVGLHLGAGSASGTYGIDSTSTSAHPLSVQPFDIEAFAQATAGDRLWGTFLVGAHLDSITGAATTPSPSTSWQGGIGIGVEGGIDLFQSGMNRLAAFMHIGGTLMTSSGYGAITFGAAYRR